MSRRLLAKSEKKRPRSFALTDAEMRALAAHARREKLSQGRFLARWLTTL